jgi:UDP-glucose 4-epimerase
MNVVVIGGAGFIGSHLADRLLAEGHAVDVIDDLSTGTLGNLADARAAGGELKIHNLDASSSDLDSLLGMRRPDLVYHLALFSGNDRSATAQGRGFSSALVLLDSARRHGINKIVVAIPASAVYGHPTVSSLPAKEGELTPRGVRGVVARAIVDLLVTHREHEGIEFSALALGSVYGPRQRPESGVVASFQAAFGSGAAPVIEGDGRQTRDFVFIDDVVDAFVRAGERGSGLVINVGTGEQTAIRDLWRRLSAGAGPEPLSAPPRPDDLVRFAVSPVRARIHLGWSPWTGLDEGLGRMRSGA